MITKEEAYKKIAELVERFGEQVESYKKVDYNETLTRRDFIDPFFKALGWDVDNEKGLAQSYREIIHEDKVKVGRAIKNPDYSFRISDSKRLFFVEAKKPSVLIKEDVQPAFQVRRYGWSAKLSVSIVTDFEEFSIYDCTKKPFVTDKAASARLKYLTFRDYLKEFDFLWETFGKEQVFNGSLEKYAKDNIQKRGTETVDKDFLHSLDNWRTYLATSIAINNKQLDEDEINFVVQQTIDRIIFLRIAEDRNVELYGNLQDAIKQGDYYQNLFEHFRKADEKYNSGIFDFKKDRISEHLKIENKIIKTIITDLYFPSPYAFGVMPVEILGTAYEQFLGKVIRITPAHRAKIELKPEVRKAGGVYYTPQYIVEYIVKNTVGKLIDGKTPSEISKIKIIDPACGSGSFLLGAFQYLLEFHKNYYSNNGKPNAIIRGLKDDVLTPDGNLTTAEKKRILLNNIFGVDIDVNAVEVTKLSLLLKCLEGETEASINHQFRMFHERVLPSLDNNIKSGNSLVDTDFYDGKIDFEPGVDKIIKPFNWQKAFPEVFKIKTQAKATIVKPDLGIDEEQILSDRVEEPIVVYSTSEGGGFDCVIGNPPYVRIQSLKDSSKDSVNYFNAKFHTAQYGNYDLYVLFVEKGVQLLKKNGILGLILPNKFFNTDYGLGLRKLISEEQLLDAIVDFKEHQVFENATTYCCLLFLRNKTNVNFYYENAIPEISNIRFLNSISINNDSIDASSWNFYNQWDNSILQKLEKNTTSLINLPSEISRGSSTGNDKIFVFEISEKGKLVNGFNEEIIVEDEILKIPIYATDFNRFNFKSSNKSRLLYPYYFSSGKVNLIAEDILKRKYPKAYKYLLSKKKELGKRKQFSHWYGYSAARNLLLHSKADIIIPLLANKGLFTTLPDNKTDYTLMAGGGFSISILDEKIDKFYLLGLLNSKLLFWYLNKISNVFRGGWITCTKQYFSQLPIKIIDKKKEKEVQNKNEIVKFVDQLLKLYEEKSSAKLQTKTEQLHGKIEYCEDRINEIVYQLYELTKEEIRIVEGK